MVFLAPFIGTVAIFASFVSAGPVPDSPAGDEVAVLAPQGVIAPVGAELAAQPGYDSWPSSSASSWSGSPTGSYGSSDSSYGGSHDGSASYVTTHAATPYNTPYTSTAATAYSTPSYGSGSSNWGGSGYNSCVQQCVAQFGAPSATYSTPTSTSTSTGSSGGSATYTVIVAPTQGVLRYVPFAINASVGDTVKFVWGANVHTVTKSSALTPCNKTDDAPFASGSQNKSFVFEQVINNTDTTFFYCGTPTHCQKGMFGIINPPSAAAGAMSVGSMMASMAANDSNFAAMWSYTSNQTSGNGVASLWGSNIDISGMPPWSYPMVAENVMYSRLFLASNPDVVNPDGTVNIGAAGSSPLMIPPDITALTNVAPTSSGTSTSGYTLAPTPTSEASSSASALPASAVSNGASSLRLPNVLIALLAVFTTFFAL